MNYNFLYNITSGQIIAVNTSNITPGTGETVLTLPDTDTTAVIAYQFPQRYLIQNNQLVAQPYFSFSAQASGNQVTLTATLNNPPATPPTNCNFVVLGQTFSVPLASGAATLALQLHPSVANQQVQVQATATGCVAAITAVGGTGSQLPLQAYQDAQGYHVAPTSKAVLQAFYTSVVSPAYALADLVTGLGLAFHVLFSKILPALTTGATPAITLTADEQNALTDITANVIPKIPTTLAVVAQVPASGQPQTYDRHYQSFKDDWPIVEQAFQNYAADLATIPNLV